MAMVKATPEGAQLRVAITGLCSPRLHISCMERSIYVASNTRPLLNMEVVDRFMDRIMSLARQTQFQHSGGSIPDMKFTIDLDIRMEKNSNRANKFGKYGRDIELWQLINYDLC